MNCKYSSNCRCDNRQQGSGLERRINDHLRSFHKPYSQHGYCVCECEREVYDVAVAQGKAASAAPAGNLLALLAVVIASATMALTIVTMEILEGTWAIAPPLVILSLILALAAAFMVEFNFGKTIARRAALHIYEERKNGTSTDHALPVHSCPPRRCCRYCPAALPPGTEVQDAP